MYMDIATRYVIETRLINLEVAILHNKNKVRLCPLSLKM